jgi:hypothetical protein
MKVEPVVLPDDQPAEVEGLKNPDVSPSDVPDSILCAFIHFASFFVTRPLYRNFHKSSCFVQGENDEAPKRNDNSYQAHQTGTCPAQTSGKTSGR